MIRLAIGHSADIDAEVATEAVLTQAGEALAGTPARAGILLVSSGVDYRQVLPAVRAAHPDCLLVGCTTAGEASSLLGFRDDSVLLLLFASEDVRFAAALAREPSDRPEDAAAEAFAALQADLGGAEPEICFLFCDALRTDPERILTTLERLVDRPLPIVGGAAAHYPPGQGETRVFFGDEILPDAFVFLALAGPVEVATAAEMTWAPIGKPGRVTAVKDNLLLSINGMPAQAFYREALGAEVQLYLGAPLAILESDGSYWLRTPIPSERESEALALSGSVALGAQVQIAFATIDDVRDGADRVAREGLADFAAERDPAFVFFCSCASRKMVLALDVETEIDQMRERLGAEVPVVGFYGYGEIGPERRDASPRFHNQTIVLAAVR